MGFSVQSESRLTRPRWALWRLSLLASRSRRLLRRVLAKWDLCPLEVVEEQLLVGLPLLLLLKLHLLPRSQNPRRRKRTMTWDSDFSIKCHIIGIVKNVTCSITK